MRLYRTQSGQWTGTQAEAVRLARIDSAGSWDQVEIPTDKPGLLAWLNEHCAQPIAAPPLSASPTMAPGIAEQEEARRVEAARQIAVEEEIQSCGWTRLATLASNVAWRYHELARDAEKRS